VSFVPTKYVSFHLNFPNFTPLFVTGQLFFSNVCYSDELDAILQAPFSIAFKLAVLFEFQFLIRHNGNTKEEKPFP
jgi:hypothetical protein